ncbi:MAG: globin [Proteobacteria bacterium]|nr:globin [Pseudomonadota bacterium]
MRDTTGAVRGEMLAMAFQCLLDLDGAYARRMIAAERVNHDAFGVPHEVFGRFFPLLADTCRELSGEAWTPQVEAAWAAALSRIAELTPG